jgi:hypothetical protein
MPEQELPETLREAIDRDLDLKRQTHDVGCEITKLMDDAARLPHGVRMMMLGDVFLSYVFQNAACKYLTDITIDFKAHFEAWIIGQHLKQNGMAAIKLRGPEEWPDEISEVPRP